MSPKVITSRISSKGGKMKHIWSLRAFLSFVFTGILLAGGVLSASAAGPITLKLANYRPPSGYASDSDAWFAQEVQKRTNGRVKIDIFWSETAAKQKEFPELARTGALDMIVYPLSLSPSLFPLNGGPNATVLQFQIQEEAIKVNRQLYESIPAMQEEYKKQNVKPVSFSAGLPYHLLSKTQIKTVDDLRGRKIRSWGAFVPGVWQKVGAVPVTINIPDLYDGLDKGLIEISVQDIGYVKFLKLYEVAKHFSSLNIGLPAFYQLLINLDKWNSLPADVQKIMDQVGRDRERVMVELGTKEIEQARQELKAAGVIFDEFPKEELQKFHRLVPDTLESWVQKTGPAAKPVADLWRQLLKNMRKSES